MELKKGYKQTEIGVIPEDWLINSLGNLGQFNKGSGVKKDDSQSGDLACIRYGELYTKHHNIINQCYSFISPEVSKSAKKIKNGDILFAGSGETKEEIGKCASFIHEYDAYAGGDIIIFTPKYCSSIFLGYLLNSKTIVNQKASKGQGDAVVHISSKELSRIIIPCPPIIEQNAIAGALSDADAYITSLEKLIEKKRQIKHGAMQELLKPKDGWELNSLGNVVKINKGHLITDSTRIDGDIPVIAGGKKPAYFHNKPNRNPNTITISGSGASAGYVSFHDYPIFASDCSTIEENNKISIHFIYYFLQSNQEKIYKMQTGGAQPHIHPSDLQPLQIAIPSKDMQMSIANILIEMDKEVSLLEFRLNKGNRIKQGMMQQLLTGKIRLK